MLKQKKGFIAVFLALCFLLSVTGAASAGGNDKPKGPPNDDFKKFDHGKKFDKHEKCFKKVWVRGFWEKIVIFKHGHKKVIKIWHPGHWKIIKVPCKHFR